MSEWIVKQNTDGQLEVVGLLVRCENCKKAKTCEWYFTNGLKNGYCDRGEADETDVDFDRTDHVTFHTKHGKEVEFAKVIRCKECKYRPYQDERGNVVPPEEDKECSLCPCVDDGDWYYNYIPKDDWYCANGEPKDKP